MNEVYLIICVGENNEAKVVYGTKNYNDARNKLKEMYDEDKNKGIEFYTDKEDLEETEFFENKKRLCVLEEILVYCDEENIKKIYFIWTQDSGVLGTSCDKEEIEEEFKEVHDTYKSQNCDVYLFEYNF